MEHEMIVSIKSDILVAHDIRYESVLHYRDLNSLLSYGIFLFDTPVQLSCNTSQHSRLGAANVAVVV